MSLDAYNDAPEKDRKHFYKCGDCGDMVDKRQLDEVMFHEFGDHKPQPDIPYGGSSRVEKRKKP